MSRVAETGTADYNGIAWFYDRHWSSHYHPWALAMLEKALLNGLPPGASLLDVCCGNGVIARELTPRGFRVTGLDMAEEMLAYARANVPAATFIRADARAFHLEPRFAGALSTFDSLNHILSPDDLLDVFRNVHHALIDGGRFVFDLNLEARYRDHWGSTGATVNDDHACFIRGNYDPATRIARTEVSLFRLQDAAWSRNDVVLLQRSHPTPEILSLLRMAGFDHAECLDAAADLGIHGHFSDARGVFVATKRSRTRSAPQ